MLGVGGGGGSGIQAIIPSVGPDMNILCKNTVFQKKDCWELISQVWFDWQVSNVNASKLTAEISICEPVITDCLSLLDAERVNAHLFSHGSHVPLVELYPVYDESGQQDETALAIEHVRFVPSDLSSANSIY